MITSRQIRLSSQLGLLLFSVGVTACGSGDAVDPFGGNASGSGGADVGGTGGDGVGGSAAAGSGGSSDQSEDCLNGSDDDGDGAIDCADDDCAALVCVAEVPDGWSGPVAFRDVENASANDLVCPDSFSSLAFEAGAEVSVAGEATCSDCACEVKQAQCEVIAWESEDGCTTASGITPGPIECVPVGELTTSTRPFGVKLGFGAGYVGACAVAKTQARLPAAGWGRRAIGCAAPGVGGGCAPKFACAPSVNDDAQLCIYREGDVECAAGYPEKSLRYRELKDYRCALCCNVSTTPESCEIGEVQYFPGSDFSCLGTPTIETGVCDDARRSGQYTVTPTAPEVAFCEPGRHGDEDAGPVAEEAPLTVCCAE